jgi:hypothetical protein
MYFKSDCSLIEHSGMMHINLYFKTVENYFLFSFFFFPLISAQTSESLLLVFTLSIYLFLISSDQTKLLVSIRYLSLTSERSSVCFW